MLKLTSASIKISKTVNKCLTVASATLTLSLLTTLGLNAQAASPIQVPDQFLIQNAHNSDFVVNQNSDNVARLNTKDNQSNIVFYGVRSATGAYEVHLKSNSQMCFTLAGGLNPNQDNGTLAVLSSNCANSLNLMFMNDQTIRVSRNLNLCLTNQGNRHSTKNNRLHFWACDGSPETKWNINSVGNSEPQVIQPQAVYQPTTYNPPVLEYSGVVKKSINAICHKPGDAYYNRTKNFTPYNTMQQCVDSGARPAKI
jgi:hypothetical protein